MTLLRFFLQRTMLVNIILTGLFGLAAVALSSTNRNALPELDLGRMQIVTLYPGASPKDVEQNVTRLIENELKGIPGIDTYTSVSSENTSNINVEISIDHPDQEEIKNEIRRAVDRVTDLPSEVKQRPEVRDLKSSESPVLTIGISGNKNTKYADLRQAARIVERDIKRISGVSQIDKYGFRDREYHVDITPEQLKNNYIALNDILYALSQRNVRSTGGGLESYRTQRNILTLSEFEGLEDIRQVIIRSAFGGGSVRIQDVARVSEGFKDERMRTIFDGKRGIMLVIKKAANKDIIEVVDALYEYVETKKKQMPPGIILSTANDGSTEVHNRINIVLSNAAIGFILVVLILILFLETRSSFLIALSIPSSFAFTFIIMPLAGVDINALTLIGMIIALGMIVDQSIVISENSLVYIQRGEKRQESIERGTREVVMPVIASVLTTVMAFVPMFVMTGLMGKFVAVMPVVVIASLVGSLLNCFLILPNHLNHTLPKSKAHKKKDNAETWQDRLFARIAVPYQRLLPLVLQYRYRTIGAALVCLIFSFWWAVRYVPLNIFPAEGADKFYIYVELDNDATFNATEEVIIAIEGLVREIPPDELDYYTARIGTNNTNDLVVTVGGQEHLAYIQVNLVPHSERSRDASITMEELRRKVLQRVKGAKSIRFDLKKPGPPVGTPITLHIHSDNDEHRRHFTERISAELKKTADVFDVSTNTKLGREEYKLDIDYTTLATVGLTVQEVASTLRIAFDGIEATSLTRNNEDIGIRVRFPLEHRQNIRNVLNLHIRNDQGQLVPIRSFATLSKIRAETAVHHTNGDVTTTITAQTGSIAQPQKIISTLLKKYTLELRNYPGVSFSYGGEAEETQKSVASLVMAFLGGLAAIYLVLALLFNSMTQPAIVLSAVPFGLIGVIWAFYLHGRPFSFISLIGVIGLSGIVVNNSLMMIEFINKILKQKKIRSLKRAEELIPEVSAGAARRLRPIIITTITTVIGLLPTAYGLGGSDPFLEPMVLALAWGLIFSTQISLFLIPALYMLHLDAGLALERLWLCIRTKWNGQLQHLFSRTLSAIGRNF